MKAFPLLVLAAALSGCATSSKITPGCYDETPESGLLWVTHTLTFSADQTFTYRRWSDDIASSEYGTGTYRLQGKMRWLAFEKQLPPPASRAQAVERVTQSDSLVLTFQVTTKPAYKTETEPVPHVTVIAFGVDNKIVASCASDESGRATLRIAWTAQLQTLRVSS